MVCKGEMNFEKLNRCSIMFAYARRMYAWGSISRKDQEDPWQASQSLSPMSTSCLAVPAGVKTPLLQMEHKFCTEKIANPISGTQKPFFFFFFSYLSVHFTKQSSLPGDMLVSWQSSTQKANLRKNIWESIKECVFLWLRNKMLRRLQPILGQVGWLDFLSIEHLDTPLPCV